MENILSVGIDVGTSTTQLIFSRLFMENTAGYFSVPRVSITDKKVVYESPVYETPLRSSVLIDVYKLREIVEQEFHSAGFTPQDTGSGAVIITGEAARKENADAVLDILSEYSGDFVVSAAGPDLESVISGKGSGACAYSKKHHCRVANLDIGGGTTNVSVFMDGIVEGMACLDIGGRLLAFDKDRHIVKISDSAGWIAGEAGVRLSYGDVASCDVMKKVAGRTAYYLEVLLGLHPDKELPEWVKTRSSSSMVLNGKIHALCFSGGVGDLIYRNSPNAFVYNDFGVFLGNAVKESEIFKKFHIMTSGETIRATVIGAGTYTTEISGSTITYSKNIFPLKNLLVMKIDNDLMDQCFLGNEKNIREKIDWFIKQRDDSCIAVAMEGKKDPAYSELQACALVLCQALEHALPGESPFILVVEKDMGKALGQIMKMQSPQRDVVVLDHIFVEDGNYMDLGKPAMGGLVIPVVIKTLIFA